MEHSVRGKHRKRSHSVLYCTVLYCSVLFCTVLFCSVLFCSVLFCSVLFCLDVLCSALFCSICTCEKNVLSNLVLGSWFFVLLRFFREFHPLSLTPMSHTYELGNVVIAIFQYPFFNIYRSEMGANAQRCSISLKHKWVWVWVWLCSEWSLGSEWRCDATVSAYPITYGEPSQLGGCHFDQHL